MGKLSAKIVRDGDLPFEEITELLHVSYQQHLKEKREYLAAKQDVEQTKQRLNGCICVLTYDDDKLIGTVSYRLIHKPKGEKKKWYEDEHFVFAGQMAVHPDYRESNALILMMMKAARSPEIQNVESVIMDTSVKAEELVKNYVGMGAQIVDLVSWPATNYYSYMFRYPMKGKRYSERYCKIRFAISAFFCKLRYSENGKRRF